MSGLFKKPSLIVRTFPMRGRPWRRGGIAASGGVIAHELGHIPQIVTKTGKPKRWSTGLQSISRTLTLEGTPFLASLAAQPVIARLPISEKKKRALHIAAGALPFAIASPMLGAELAASRRALKILRAAGASARRLRHTRKQLAAAYSTYLAAAAPGSIGAGLTAAGYVRRSRKRERRRR